MRRVSFFDFEMYAPYSRGASREKTDHALLAPNIIFDLLGDLSVSVSGEFKATVFAEEFGKETQDNALALKSFLDGAGSDKANKHNYHLVLGRLLRDRNAVRSVMEIGLGTNNPKIVSNI